jgi:hypothetical protein
VSTGDDDFDHGSAAVPPSALFVAADEPLLIFPAAWAAELSLEPFDVEEGVYRAAYGPNGEPYCIRTDGSTVSIEATGEPNRPEALRTLLLEYFRTTGQAFDHEAPTSQLVQQAWHSDHELWREKDPYGERFTKPFPLSCCAALVLIPAIILSFVLTGSWVAIPFVAVPTLLILALAVHAQRRAEKMDFRGR